jgi:hypothetical protein
LLLFDNTSAPENGHETTRGGTCPAGCGKMLADFRLCGR